MGGDVLTTHLILEAGGRELNPYAQPFLDWAGTWGLVVQKAAAWVIVMGLASVGYRHAPRVYWVSYSLLAAFPVGWNLRILV